MQKLLVFLLVLAAIFWGRRLLSQLGGGTQKVRRETHGDASAERMESCRRCGVHVPESEGVMRHGDFYCCDAHARGQDD